MARFVTLWIAIASSLVSGCEIRQRPAELIVKQTSVNGVTLMYQEQGQGSPVVFVHGSVADYRVWNASREAIARQHRFIALSQRYFGTELWGESGPRFSTATHVDDLTAFIKKLNLGPVHVVGWSYGGDIELVLAVQHPELVKSLFVFEPGLATFVTDAADVKVVADDGNAMAAPGIAASKAGDDVEALRLFLDGVNDQPGAFEGFPSQVRSMFTDNARTIPLELAAPPPPTITCVQLGQIRVPVAIVRGELTRPYFRIIADTASRCIPGSRLVVLPKARHLAPAQDPSAFNEALLDFLKGIN